MSYVLNNPVPTAEWNQTETGYPAVCIHELFEQQVLRTPNRIAACFEGRQLTYEQLNARANRFAQYLVQLGDTSERLVGIFLRRSLDMLVGLLGILKAGGAYVPLDPDYPSDRLSFMLEDSQAQLLVTDQQLVSRLRTWSGRAVLLDRDRSAIEAHSEENPSVGVMPDNLAYTLYTSGSTGKPKGVQIEHRSVVNFLTSMAQCPGLTADDVMLAVTTLSFDIAGLELYLPLTAGARTVIVSREVAADGEQLLSAIESNSATVMQATPVTWRLLLDAGWRNGNLKVICGGEALPRELARRLVNNSPSVWNLYGPTETTIWSSIYRVVQEDRSLVPIGRPIANTQMYILDPGLEPVPVGDIGELYIGGDGLARGYLNRPELTAEKFISNPFRPGTRLYKTGDLARYLPSGDIEFLGRTDHQVKIRGFRIELGEIEAVLEEHPQVRQAVVVAKEFAYETRLIAYFIAQPGTQPSGTALRCWLKEKLTDYMMPASFVRLDAMPLTANGKVDRQALPAPKPEELTIDENFLAPRDDLETQLIKIWEGVLGKSGIGVRDNFFELGGYSVLAVKVLQRIEQECGRKLPTVALFQAPTVEALAGLLRQEPAEQSFTPKTMQGVPPHHPDRSLQFSKPRNSLRKSILCRFRNRILHMLCRVLPGATNVRPVLHRLRGVRIGHHVFIGDDVYIENEYPERVEIHDGAMVGLRTTIVAHGHGGSARVIIGKNAFVGVGALVVAPGDRPLTIGEGSILMPGAVVTSDVSPFTVYGIEQAKPLASVTKPFIKETTYEEFVTSLQPLRR
jgi:amino acid adenylation domain-containing protein